MNDKQLRALMAALLHSVGAKGLSESVGTADAILKRVRDMFPEHEETAPRGYMPYWNVGTGAVVTGTGGSDMAQWAEEKRDDVELQNRLKKERDRLEAENKELAARHNELCASFRGLMEQNDRSKKDVVHWETLYEQVNLQRNDLETRLKKEKRNKVALKEDIQRYSRAINNLWDKLYEIQDIAEDVVTRIPIDDPDHQQLNRIICIAKGKEDT